MSSFINRLVRGANDRAELIDEADFARDVTEKVVANTPPAPPKRIGDTPPAAYVDGTMKVLNERHEKFVTEMHALERDIDKLMEERRQIKVAIDAIEAAMAVLEQGIKPMQQELTL